MAQSDQCRYLVNSYELSWSMDFQTKVLRYKYVEEFNEIQTGPNLIFARRLNPASLLGT